MPLGDIFGVSLKSTFSRAVEKEETQIETMFKDAIGQLNSLGKGIEGRTCKLIENILGSSDKLDAFENVKHQLGSNICRILRPALEREHQYRLHVDDIENKKVQPIADFIRDLNNLGETLGSATTKTRALQRLVEKYQSTSNPLLTEVINNFVNGVTQPTKESRSVEAMKLIQEHFHKSIIPAISDNECEREMDLNDKKLSDSFMKAIRHIERQRRTPN